MSDPGRAGDAGATKSALRAAGDWLARDGKVVLATVIRTWGSAPVPVGGHMVVAANGDFHGSVSGGCVEGEVIAEAEDVLAHGRPQRLTFGVADETAWEAGLPCGGEIDVYVERIEADGPGTELIQDAIAAQDGRKGIVIATNLESGARTLYERGTDGVPDGIARRFRTGKSEIVETADGPTFYQSILPPARCVVIGATHIAQLFSRFARIAGYDVAVVDPRTAFASENRFADVKLHADWPQDVLPKIGLDAYTALVVVAHVAHIDDEALKLGLKSDCLYIGALGSRRNHEKRVGRLKEAGFSDGEIARIKCPIGLDIGAVSPAEIAIGIMAEVVLAVRGAKHPDRAMTEGHQL